jgi:hypothetical protein
MKMKRIGLIVLLFFFACCENNKIEEQINTSELIISERLGLKIGKEEDHLFKVKYFDGQELIVEKTNEELRQYLISGSRISNQKIGVQFESFLGSVSFNDMSFFRNDFKEELSREEFSFLVNGLVKAPCSEHPDEESLTDCFKREIDEFCDSLVSCVFLAANAKVVATIIAIHCLWCH